VKLRSCSTSDLPRKIISPEKKLILPPVFHSDKHETLSVRLETVCLNVVCTIDLIKTLLDAVHEDVTVLKRDKALLKSEINKLHENICQPRGSLFSRVGLQADKEFADPSREAALRHPARSYAAVAVSGSAHTALPSKVFADRGITLVAASLVPSLSTVEEDPDAFKVVTYRKKTTIGVPAVFIVKHSRQPLVGVRNLFLTNCFKAGKVEGSFRFQI
jgi:hypothetical protein